MVMTEHPGNHFKASNNLIPQLDTVICVSLIFETSDECATREQYLTPKPPKGAVAHTKVSLRGSKTTSKLVWFDRVLYLYHFLLFFMLKNRKNKKDIYIHYGNNHIFLQNFCWIFILKF